MKHDAGQDGEGTRGFLGGAVAWVLALATFGLYGARVLARPYVLDSAELAAASFGMGVAHPPGQPLALLLGRAFCLLPFGSVAFRVGLSQALCGTAAVLAVYALTMLATAHLEISLRPSLRTRVAVAVAASIVFALSPGARDVSCRPEVYALASALALWSLWLAQKSSARDDARWAAAAAFLVGLGLSNHPLIAGTTGLGAVLSAAPLLRQGTLGARVRLGFAALGAFLCGCLVMIYVPARTLALTRHPDPNTLLWGDARSLSGWWWVLSARTFAEKNSLIQTSADPSSLPFLFLEEVGLPAMVFALLGMYGLVRMSAAGRWHVLPLLVCAAGAIASGLFGGLDPHNPDIRGYLGAAFAIAAVLAGVGAAVVIARTSSLRIQKTIRAGVCAALLAWPCVALVIEASAADQGLAGAERITGSAIAALPPRAVLLTGHFETGFLLSYQLLAEAQRPDVTWAHMGFARGPGYADRVLRLAPNLAPLFAAHAHGPITAQAVEKLDAALAVEASVPLDPDLAQALSYGAGLWHWPPAAAEGDPSGVDPQLWPELTQRREVKSFVMWRLFQDARLACQSQHPASQALVNKLRRLMPQDALVEGLASSCR